MPAYAIDGVTPVVAESAFVHPTAVLIGDVIIGAGCYVGPLASLRGDFGRISVHDGANVQDGCVLHCFPGREVVVDTDGHIGHGAVLHGCHIGRRALVGMNSVVMDGCRVGATSFVGANSFVPADTEVPPGQIIAGTPAVIVRSLTDQEIAWKANGTAVYQDLARRSRATLRPVEPLRAIEDSRPLLNIPSDRAVPLREFRKGWAAPPDR
jgi:phenylacetic acid degradation protein